MRGTSHREYLTWEEWWRDEVNRPDRTAFYLMQVAAEVRRANDRVRNPSLVENEHFRVEVSYRAAEPVAPETPEAAALRARSRWFGFLRIPDGGGGG